MALLTFPPFPVNGEIYPAGAPVGTNTYQWNAAEQTWVLIGPTTGVTAGTYGNGTFVPRITIDVAGRITVAQDFPIQVASTSQAGLVRLEDSVTSTSTGTALTANQGQRLQSQIGNLNDLNVPAPNLVFAINNAGGSSGGIVVDPPINGFSDLQSVLENAVYSVSSPNLTVTETPTGLVSITLPDTSVVPGNYTSANITVDAQGRIIAATDGTGGAGSISVTSPITDSGTPEAPVIGILQASTNQLGAVQLADTLSSTSVDLALTAAQGKILQDQINAISGPGAGLNNAGTFNAQTGLMVNVTLIGSDAGFAVGANVPLAVGSLADYFVIVTTPGIYSPPGQTGDVYDLLQGDWLFCNGTKWVQVSLGTTLPYASTTSPGAIEIATNPEVQNGADAIRAVTPAGLQSKISNSVSTTSSTTIASSTAVKTAFDTADAAVPCSTFVAKGNILAAVSAGVPTALPVGTNGQVLTVNSACSSGLAWEDVSATGSVSLVATGTGLTGGPITCCGTISLANTGVSAGSYTLPTITINAQGQIVSAGNGSAVTSVATGSGLTGGPINTTGTIALSQATELSIGGSCVATQADVNAGADDRKYVTPLKMATYVAAAGGGSADTVTLNPAINGNTTVQLALQDTVYDVKSSGGSLTITEAPTGLVDANVTQATEAQLGGARVATQADVDAGVSDAVYVTPLKLAGVFSSGSINSSNIDLSTTINSSTTIQEALEDAIYNINSNNLTITEAPVGQITIDLPNTTVTPGSYTYAAITVDGQGRLTVAGSGVAPSTTVQTPITNVGSAAQPVIGILSASTTRAGSVQLNDSLTSTSADLALTAAQGKILQDQINNLVISGGLTSAGTFDAATGQMVTVTTLGAAEGFTVGADVLSPVPALTDFFVTVVVAGTYTPPGGGGPFDLLQGDWLFCNGTNWVQVNVASRLPYASTTAQGAVCLATDADTQNGLNALLAVTPASLQSKVSDFVTLNSSTSIASSAAVKLAYDLAAVAIPCSIIVAKGDIVAGQSTGLPAPFGVGGDGQVLTANSANGQGLGWTTPCSGTVTTVATGTGLTGGPITDSGTIALANTAVTAGVYSYATFTVDPQGRITAATSNAAPVPLSILNAKGTLISATAPNTAAALALGTDGQVLVVDSACSTGLKWGTPPAIGSVTQVDTGAGLTGGPITSTGTISMTDTGVIAGNYTVASFTVDAQGRITSASSGTAGGGGTVTQVDTGIGLTGGPITNTGTIALADTTVVAGNYTYASFDVDSQGRLTSATSGVGPNTNVVAPITNTGTTAAPVIGIQAGTTTQSGAVQLEDSRTSTSTTLALTAAQGKILQDQINNLTISGGLTSAGTFDASTGQMVTVTTLGSSAGFTIGANVPSPIPSLTDYFVTVVVAGTYTPPGGGGPFDLAQGDWLFCNGTNWVQVNVAAKLPYASTTAQGAVCLATDLDVQTGTNSTLAVTPSTLQSKVSDSVALSSSTTIASSVAAKQAYDIGFAALPCSAFISKGVLISASGSGVPTALTVGSEGQVLAVDSLQAEGIAWVTPCSGTLTQVDTGVGLTGGPITTTGTISLDTTTVTPGSYSYAALTVDQYGRLLSASSGSPPILCSSYTDVGDLLVGNGANVALTLPVGSNDQVLIADSNCAGGVKWGAASAAGGGSVTQVDTGTGLQGGPITTTGTISLTNTGVVAGSYTAANIIVDGQGRITSAANGTGGGGGTVTSVDTGTGLTGGPITITGTIALANTTVTAGNYTNPNLSIDAQGRITNATSGPSSVTQVNTGTGLTGGPITSTGTIDLANTAVTPGSYTYGSFTVDAQGRISDAASGAAPSTSVVAPITNSGTSVAPVIGVNAASTTGAGVVQLNNTLTSTSTTQALTAAQGKSLQDQLNNLALSGGLTNAGTFDASTAQMVNVSNSGAAAGFTVGANVPLPNASLADYFVQVTTGGTYTPPGGSTPLNLLAGDWLFCNGTAWVQVEVAARLEYASDTVPGIIEIATQAEANTGTDALLAITPATLQGKMSDSIALNDSNTIASSAAVFAAANSAGNAITCSILNTKGDLIVAASPQTPIALPVGANGSVLLADSTCTEGMRWATVTVGTVTQVDTGTGLTGGPITDTGTIALANTAVNPGSYTYASITVDQQGRLTAATSGAAPVTSVTASAPIVSSGGATPNLTLADTTVVPGNYTYANITVDQKGRITAASAGTTPSTSVTAPILNTGTTLQPIIGVSGASTSAAGVVQLNDTLTSTSVTQALTANQGRVLQEQINNLVLSGGLTNAGTFDASSSQMITVSNAGSAAGFTVGANVLPPSVSLTDYFVQVTVGGTYTPPGTGGPYDLIPGDWLFCNGTQWIQVEVAARLEYASDTIAGIIELATQPEVTAGTDGLRAVTPATLQGKMSDSIALNDPNTIASSAAVFAAAQTSGSGIPASTLTAKGDLIGATGPSAAVAIPVGADGQVLTANSSCAAGVEWLGGIGGGTVTSVTAGVGLDGGTITSVGTIDIANTGVTAGSYTNASITVNNQGQLTLASSGTAPVTSVSATAPILSTGGLTPLISLADSTVTPNTYTYATVTVNQKGLITGASSGAAPVSTVTATAPIISSGGTTPDISLANTSVTAGSYTNASLTVDQQGRLTSASSGPQPVISVTGTAPIASTGGANPVISLNDTAVTAGSYTYASFTVDAQGRLTSATSNGAPSTSVTSPITNSGTAIAPVIGIQASSTTQAGAVQLVDNLTSTSNTNALTAAQGKILQDQISTLAITGGLTNAGTFDASLGQMVTVSNLGAQEGFVVGQDVPSPSGPITDFFVIITVPGTYTPPGGSAALTLIQGDWLFCNGTDWVRINIGATLPYASTTTAGAVCFATPLETQTGVNNTKAVTSADLQSKVSDSVALTSSTTIASSTAVKTSYDLAACAVPCSVFTAKGDLLVGGSAGNPVALPVGNDGQVIVADSGSPDGLAWTSVTVGTVTQVDTGTGLTGGPITDTGTIALANTAVTPGDYTYGSFTVDQQGRITAASSGAAPVTNVQASSPIASSGGATPTISLLTTTVNPGSYTNASLTVDAYGRLTAASSGAAPVESVTGSTPISSTGGVNPVISLNDTTVTPGSYSGANITVDQQGRITAASNGTVCTGTVTQVSTGAGLTGGPITTTGTIALADTSVTAGSYNYANLTVDAQGRLTAASSGIAPSTTVVAPILNTGTSEQPVIGIRAATTSQTGAVQLNDTRTSTSTTQALTANAGKILQDQINTLSSAGTLVLAGTLDATTGDVLTVTQDGSDAGFQVGQPLPTPTVGLKDYFVIATVAGTYSPPGGGGPYTVTQGDWFLVNNATWEFLNVGLDTVPQATTTVSGTVELATNAETQTGTDATRAVTPAALQSKISNSINLNSSTSIASSAAVKSAYDAAVAAANFQYVYFDDISGLFNGTTTSFTLAVSSVATAPTPSTNVMVFIGGVPQTPGATGAYTITGSTITFTTAPPTGASFIATTIASV